MQKRPTSNTQRPTLKADACPPRSAYGERIESVVAGIGDPGRRARLITNSSSLASPMPATDDQVHKHLRRLERVWIDQAIYFITTCTFGRRAILATDKIATLLSDEWRNAHDRHGWAIGRYVIMPDHVHFFCPAELDAKSLPVFMQKWKQ